MDAMLLCSLAILTASAACPAGVVFPLPGLVPGAFVSPGSSVFVDTVDDEVVVAVDEVVVDEVDVVVSQLGKWWNASGWYWPGKTNHTNTIVVYTWLGTLGWIRAVFWL